MIKLKYKKIKKKGEKMNRYITLYLTQLIIVGMAINVRTDVPFWKQFLGYLIIASILPIAHFLENNSAEKLFKEDEKGNKREKTEGFK